ncbi:vancomycin resistance protein YoaR [Anaerosolibacter carboniphilus]|uniref:Vancomycin resistance protein YoaR n=1 Tax=Anaerosolibacter carboniphilus TaxID=1417629 RepID=A0A841KYQ7_9FIRM|nr:VanW family protein [Anaerosolibacter carboniphilus]MBB6217100.1 vancomycin resistance protein YoaR [Anaerosolibacter carboniphilus]
MRKVFKFKIFITAIIVIIFATPVVAFGINSVGKIYKILPQNVMLNDLSIGKKDIQEVQEILNEIEREMMDKKIIVVFSDADKIYQKEYELSMLGYGTNKLEILDEIRYIVENELTLIEKIKAYNEIKKQGKAYRVAYTKDEAKFIEALDYFDQIELGQPQNAQYKYENGKIIIIGGASGYSLDKEELFEMIDPSLIEKEIHAEIPLKEIPPEISKSQLEQGGVKERVSVFSTTFDPNNRTRTNNLKKAVKTIDGTVLVPGQEFSFNQIVGKRTIENGYQEAGIYVNGQVKTGLGGGICQVSTTLYNAALLFDLEIQERHPHSLTVPYVPLSRDAAVSWGSKDFRFVNNTPHNIFIHGEIRGNQIIFELFSTADNKEVKLISQTIASIPAPIKEIEDETMVIGERKVTDPGHVGYKSKLIKEVYIDGSLAGVKTMSTDNYMATSKIIKVGTKEKQMND